MPLGFQFPKAEPGRKRRPTPRTRWTFVPDTSWGAGIAPSGLRSGRARRLCHPPRFGGRGRLLTPLGGFLLLQHLSLSENRPARRPAVPTPGEGTPPPTRGAFQTQTRRSKTAFLFFSPAVEGKKGTLRPIHIHTGKHLGWGEPWSVPVTLGQVPRRPSRGFLLAKWGERLGAAVRAGRRDGDPNARLGLDCP